MSSLPPIWIFPLWIFQPCLTGLFQKKTGAIEDMKFLGVIKVLGWFFWLWNFQGVYQKFAKFSGVCPQPSFFRKPTDYRRGKIYGISGELANIFCIFQTCF